MAGPLPWKGVVVTIAQLVGVVLVFLAVVVVLKIMGVF